MFRLSLLLGPRETCTEVLLDLRENRFRAFARGPLSKAFKSNSLQELSDAPLFVHLYGCSEPRSKFKPRCPGAPQQSPFGAVCYLLYEY